jgi:hypothetical protein
LNWRKSIFIAAAAGIAAFAGYGVWNTTSAYADHLNGQNADSALISGAAAGGSSLTPDGAGCNPGGCAVCGGCIFSQYQQSIETLPVQDALIEQTD